MKINDRIISHDFMPYYVAEACNNHGGSLEVAKAMVEAADNIGANACKFQLRFGPGYLTNYEYEELYHTFRGRDIVVFFTVFDDEGIELAKSLRVPVVKIGSAEWIDFQFVKRVTTIGAPMIVSTGGGERTQVDTLAEILKNSTLPCALLHCMSIYPCPSAFAYLDLIRTYRYYALPIGFSDHTLGIHLTLAAIAKGACIIEKHFTLDPRIGGPDQHISLMPKKFQELVDKGDAVWRACLPVKKIYLKEEREKLSKFREKSV